MNTLRLLPLGIAFAALACGGTSSNTSATSGKDAGTNASGGTSQGQGGQGQGPDASPWTSGNGGDSGSGAGGNTAGTGGGGVGGSSHGGSSGSGGVGGNQGGSSGTGGGSTGGCHPGDTRVCGTSNQGQCRFGQETCVTPGTWSGTCVGNIEPTKETCNGKDDDCNGTVDNGTYLPARYDSMEWIPASFANQSPGILITWGSQAAIWDRDQDKVTQVMELNQLWALGSTGTPPPNGGIDAIILVAKGVFGATADSMWVTKGPNLYALDGATGNWAVHSLQSLIGLSEMKAAVVLYPGDLGLTEHTLFFVSGSRMYSWTSSHGLSQDSDLAAHVLCPTGTQGTCPPGVGSMARLEDQSHNVALIVGYEDKSYITPLVTGQPFSWSLLDVSSVPCHKP